MKCFAMKNPLADVGETQCPLYIMNNINIW